MVQTIAALKAGFSIMQPLVDYEFTANKNMQLNLLFTLPEVSSENALCILEQLVPTHTDTITSVLVVHYKYRAMTCP